MEQEALDRIHVVTTLLASILYDGETHHEGLSEGARKGIGYALDLLHSAYQLQGEHVALIESD